jgi:hypothetical protein
LGDTMFLMFREWYGSMVLYESIWKCELSWMFQSGLTKMQAFMG